MNLDLGGTEAGAEPLEIDAQAEERRAAVIAECRRRLDGAEQVWPHLVGLEAQHCAHRALAAVLRLHAETSAGRRQGGRRGDPETVRLRQQAATWRRRIEGEQVQMRGERA